LEQLSGFFNSYIESRALTFHHAGHISTAPSAASLLGLTGTRHTCQGMQPITQLPKLFTNLDIGIVPLNNIPFNYAKSYLKGLEYAIAGIPFVCSYSPEYQSLTASGVGRLANSANEWEYHLDELLDAEMWLDEREYNRELVMENYSIDKRTDEWEKVFTAIMDIK
jgi:glycosyltransferase involved in cell wall biosynthesis